MATQVLPENNVFTGTDANEFANSTVADESFTMGAGENVINFDLSNNNHLGTDEIHLTPGEDLTLNFYALNSIQIKWERVGNDIVIKTLGYQTWGYAMCVVTASDIVDYVTSDNVTYYKSLAKYYLYNYETNEYVLQNE